MKKILISGNFGFIGTHLSSGLSEALIDGWDIKRGKDIFAYTFDKAVNISHADSEGESFLLMGQDFTIGADTDTDTIILYKMAKTITLSVGGANPNPSEVVEIGGKEYTVELTTSTDTAATIRVTDSEGNSDSKKVNEADSKKIQGLEVAVNLADESTALDMISAEITVGAQKVKLETGNEVKLGTEETAVDNTNVDFGTGNPNNLTTLMINISATDTDSDAILAGDSFVDPVFGTVKVNFAGLNIPEESTARETIAVKYSGDDKATMEMTTHTGDTKSIYWYYNDTSAPAVRALADSDGNRIKVIENTIVNKSMYVAVGNEDEGYLLEVTRIYNATTGYSNDEVIVEDVFSGKTYNAVLTNDGDGTLTVGGKSYTVVYRDNKALSDDEYLTLDYPDTTTALELVVYPTIETSKGALIAFYEPLTINLTDPDNTGPGVAAAGVGKLHFPD